MSGGNGVPDAAHQAAVLARLDQTRAALDRLGVSAEEIHRAVGALESALHDCYRQLRLARERLQGHQEQRP